MRAYIYWDLVINSAWGLLGPIFAIFILEKISAGNVIESAKVVGISAFVYWIVKSILQMPIAKYLDENHGELDDFWFYVVGNIIMSLAPFGFLISSQAWHIYVFQTLHAIGMSILVPASYAIFIRHADKGKEAYESGLDSTLLGVGAGITGAIGGIAVAYIGFSMIFILVGTFNFLATFLILPVRKDMFPKAPRDIHGIPPETKPFEE